MTIEERDMKLAEIIASKTKDAKKYSDDADRLIRMMDEINAKIRLIPQTIKLS